MSKQTVPLSTVVDHAISESHPTPCTKGYETICKIVHTIPSASPALKIQLITKMKAYHNKFLPSKEMYYCLCLMDYLVRREESFRKVVVADDFLQWFEIITNFSNIKSRLGKQRQVDIVTERSMRIVQTWGVLFPNELGCYTLMFLKYKERGVIFHLPEPSDYRLTQHNDTINTYMEQVEECSFFINDAVMCINRGLNKKNYQSLLKYSLVLRTQLKRVFEVQSKSNETDEQQMEMLKEVSQKFSKLVDHLEALMDVENKKLFKTVSGVDMNLDHISRTQSSIAVNKREGSGSRGFDDSIRDEMILPRKATPTATRKFSMKSVFRSISSVKKDKTEEGYTDIDSE